MLFSFLTANPRPERVVRVKITSGTVGRPWNEPTRRSLVVGEEIDCTPGEAAELTGAGRAVQLGEVAADDAIVVAKPAPRAAAPVFEPKPYPVKWDALPKVFRAAWDKLQELDRLRTEHAAVVAGVSGFGTMRIGGGAGANERIVSESRQRLEQREKAEGNLRNFDRESLDRALFDCGKIAINERDSANGLRDALAEVGFEIFTARVAALGLHDQKVRRLFDGSADCQKYVLTPIGTGDMRRAGGTTYLDLPLDAMADTIFRARELRATCDAKLIEAKAELKRAAAAAPKSKNLGG